MPGSTVPTSGANQGRKCNRRPPHSATPQSTSEDATTVGRTILSEDEIRRCPHPHLAYEIIETNKGVENLVLIGIRSRACPSPYDSQPASKPSSRTSTQKHESAPWTSPPTATTSEPAPPPPQTPQGKHHATIGIEGKTVVLVDDVLYSGRTVRAALDALNAHGRPALVRLAVLVDRGHRQLPIRADHVGKNLPTSASETVRVVLTETDNATDRVDIIQLGGLS